MKQILTIGGISAAISIVLGLILKFAVGPATMLSTGYLIFSSILGIVILVVLGRKFLRTEEFPSLSYGEALKYLFPAGLLAYVITMLFSVVLYQNDPVMKEAFTEYTVKAAQTGVELGMTLAGAGDDEAKIAIEKEKVAAETRANADEAYPFQFSKMPLNVLNGLIAALINALIASIFVKYNNKSA